jgi:Domain of unknown function (DUF4136)
MAETSSDRPVRSVRLRGRTANCDGITDEEVTTMLQHRGKSTAVAGGVLFCALLACSLVLAQDVTTNSMPGINFSKYHTYKWVAVEGAAQPNQIVDAQIKQSVDAQLATKGLTKTDGDNADLDVAYQAAVNQEKQWNAYGTGGGLRWGGGMGTATQSTIAIGTIVLDMYDPSTKQLVWQGRATKTLDPGANQQKKQKNLDKAMQKLLKSYPPK